MVSDKCCRLCLDDINVEVLSFRIANIDELYKTLFDLFGIDIKPNDLCRWICNTCYETTLKFKEYKLKVAECQKIIENYEFLNKSMNSTISSNDLGNDECIGDKSVTEFNINSRISSQLQDKKLEKSEYKMSYRKLRSEEKESERLTRSKIKTLKTNSTKNKKNLKFNNRFTKNKNKKKLKTLINRRKCELKNIAINLFKLENNNIDLRLLDEEQNPIEFDKLSYIEIEQLHESIIIPEIWSSFLNFFQNRKITRSTKKKLKVILNKSEYEKLLD